MTFDVISTLWQTDMLRSAPVEDLEAVTAASRMRPFRRGQVVFIRGEPGDTVLVVLRPGQGRGALDGRQGADDDNHPARRVIR